MKQTFYLYLNSYGSLVLRTHSDKGYLPDIFLGTVELDVQPIKKEVEKEISVDDVHRSKSSGITATDFISFYVPRDAYDVKVVYKIKE